MKRIAISVLLCFLAIALAMTPAFAEPLPGGTLDPTAVDKFVEPLIIPPAIPRSDKIGRKAGKNIDYYEIAVRQFTQQVLPSNLPMTTVWGYGAVDFPGTVAEGGSFNFPAFTIEAKYNKPVRVKWINDLVDANGDYLPHLLPVDQTLHWANPLGDCKDCRGTDPAPYGGPVPMIVHVHGAETTEWSDGYPEAWYLPAARDIPAGAFTSGSFFDTFKSESPLAADWAPGTAVFEYQNDQPATTLWYHDHTLGMTRVNVYAGPAGFYILRGGPGDAVMTTKGKAATLPGPAPQLGDAPGTAYYEIPIVIQDRSFNADGSLYYPDNRAFFEGLEPDQLQVPFIPDDVVYEDGTNGGPSDVSPVWNPEFFGNTMVVNGRTWPYQEVEQRRYRLRYLNGCDSRFLILKHDQPLTFWQIGASQGFLPAPVELDQLLLGPAERADVIVDFSALPVGTEVTLINLAPDEPFGGGIPGVDFDPSDPGTTGQVMKFRVVARNGADKSTPPQQLVLPQPEVLAPAQATRTISLNELESETVLVAEDADGNIVLDLNGDPFGPTEARLGTLDAAGNGVPLGWADPTTENAGVGATEIWEIYNFTADAHPIHIHLVQFQVVDRQELVLDDDGDTLQPAELVPGSERDPEPSETGFKDTVISYPGEVTRVKARFDLEGLFVWHCHILEHEDNEMMRPYCVGNSAACQQHNSSGGGH